MLRIDVKPHMLAALRQAALAPLFAALICVATPASATPCTRDDDCGFFDAKKPIICEAGSCQPTTSDALWQWAVSIVPELRQHKLESWRSLSDWVGAAEWTPLWFNAKKEWPSAPAQCVSYRFHLNTEGTLSADIPERFGQRAGAIGVWTTTLVLSYRKDRLGSSRRHRDGGMEATSGMWSDAPNRVGTVYRDAIRYDGHPYKLEVSCPLQNVTTDTRCPACMSCTKFQLTREFLRGPHEPIITMRGPIRNGEPVDCKPCVPDPRSPLLPRLRHALQDRTFIKKESGGAAFFRSREACERELPDTGLRMGARSGADVPGRQFGRPGFALLLTQAGQ